MDFRNIIFYVKDLKSTVEFYERALGLKREVYTEEYGYAEVRTNKSFISFVNEEIARKFIKKSDTHNNLKEVPSGCEIVFMVEDVDKAFEKAVKEEATPVLKRLLCNEVQL